MIKLNIAGDFVPYNQYYINNEIDLSDAFDEVAALNRTCDYSIVNLECPIVLSKAQPIEKCGPSLKTNENAAKALKYAHFDGVTLSNNHFYDYGEEGVKDTLDILHQHGIDHVGGGLNLQEASKTLYKTIKEKTIAFINCSEHEFSTATDKKGGANPLDIITQYDEIKNAKEKADYVILIVHGGIEAFCYPSPRMKKTYRFFIDSGADAVINHHQHYYSGFEIYKDRPIVYGLGNLLFDTGSSSSALWNTGYMIHLLLEKSHVAFDIVPYKKATGQPRITLLKDKELQSFHERLERLNAVIDDDHRLQEEYDKLLTQKDGTYRSILTPYTSKFLNYAHSKGLLPSFFPKKKKIILLNRIECESHRERLIAFLKGQIK